MSIVLLLQLFVVAVHERFDEVFQAEPLVFHFPGAEAPRVEIELVGRVGVLRATTPREPERSLGAVSCRPISFGQFSAVQSVSHGHFGERRGSVSLETGAHGDLAPALRLRLEINIKPFTVEDVLAGAPSAPSSGSDAGHDDFFRLHQYRKN